HTIIRTDHGAIINWSNFNTSTGQSVTFNQFDGAVLSSQSAVLNRISSGAVPTEFNGALNANGRVFVVNPAGVVFGAGSTVNVAQLVASGLNMTDDAFNAALDPANEMVFEGGSGRVTNRGHIKADSVYLIGKKVLNLAGGIIAQNGLVVMAAGDNVYIAQDGSNVLVQLEADPGGDPFDIRNETLVSARNDGTIVLAAGDTFSRSIKNNSYIVASGGTITARAARIEQTGRMQASASGGEAGSISLTGLEEVVLGPIPTGIDGYTVADGEGPGNGGDITLASEGTVTVGDGHFVSARGGTLGGDGGSVKITANHFVVAPTSNIDASPQNLDYEPGTLEINTPNVTIADGANAGAADTVYEQDIESLSDKGTSLVVNSQQGITVPAITDGEIKGRFGNIELHAMNEDSFVTFEDATNTISTTLGDIIMGAGSGGIAIGNLETAKDISDSNPTPGQIVLSTFNRGNIKTGDLLVKSGWGHAEINVNASGDLVVNGDVVVGSDTPILNIPDIQPAEAMIFLKAGDNVTLDGNVTASAHGLNAGIEAGVTKAYIGIFSGTNEVWFGNMTINGDLMANAISSAVGTSDATIEIDSWGTLTWGPDAADPVADADSSEVRVQSKESASESSTDGDVAKIVVNAHGNSPTVLGVPDFATIHMGTPFGDNVLDNDLHPSGAQLFTQLAEGPKHATSFNLDLHGNYTYTPQPGFVGEDTFTYTAISGMDVSDPTLVTITITNTPPVAQPQAFIAPMSILLRSSITDGISDPDGDPLMTALVTDAVHGTVTMNPDGTFFYAPDAGFVGEDTFTYSVTDGQIGGEPVKALVTMTLTNTPPVPAADEAATGRSVPIVINVLANDSDIEGNPLKVLSFSYSGSGTIKINNNNTITYTSSANFIGKDSFTYLVTDGEIGGTPVEAMVTVFVSPVTAPPPAYFMPTGPNLDKSDVDISGCPALTEWAAGEIGVDKRRLQIWIVNGLASARGVQPCEACLNLRKAAAVLADPEGSYADAIGLIIDEFGSRNSPMTEELAAYITNAMSYDGRTREHYAKAEEYFDALSDYMAVLHQDMGFSPEKAARIVARKYIDQLVVGGNVGVASYVSARLDSVTMFLTVLRLSGAVVK
ncbi:MAG: tandem-95 repeat protein, partial [Phycisphaerales bacterium]